MAEALPQGDAEEPAVLEENEKERKTNPHVYGQSELLFQKLFEAIQPTCVILPATVPVPGLSIGLCLGTLESHRGCWPIGFWGLQLRTSRV